MNNLVSCKARRPRLNVSNAEFLRLLQCIFSLTGFEVLPSPTRSSCRRVSHPSRSTSKSRVGLCIGVVGSCANVFWIHRHIENVSRVSKVKVPDGLHLGNHVKMFARRRPQQSVAARAQWQLSRLPPLSLHLRLEVKAKELSQRVFAVAKVC